VTDREVDVENIVHLKTPALAAAWFIYAVFLARPDLIST